jgi:nitrate reductase gamma subunit
LLGSRAARCATTGHTERTAGKGGSITPTALDRRALLLGLAATGLVLFASAAGSGWFQWFDTALAGYLFGVLFFVFATVYRYSVWLRRPPTARLHARGWQALWRTGERGRNSGSLLGLIVKNLLLQTFIFKRSKTRWVAHQTLFWGCMLAVAVTFPLTLGWIHFTSAGQSPTTYETTFTTFTVLEFEIDGVVAWLFFHALDISAVLVLVGVFIFLFRRLKEPGALATTRSNDHLALAGLFAVSVTGLMLTVSHQFLDGQFYSFINVLHALTVMVGLAYIPFGKLFHIFQRPANLGVQFYKREAAAGEPATCSECGEGFASQLQVGDLKDILPDLGFDYDHPGGGNWQDVCPACRRRLVARTQSLRVGGFG